MVLAQARALMVRIVLAQTLERIDVDPNNSPLREGKGALDDSGEPRL